MAHRINWNGVFPAFTTKLKPDFTLDIEAIAAGIERQLAAGVSGLVMMGMVGENAQLSHDEKLTVLRTAKEVVRGRVPIVSGLGETSTDRAVAYARAAEDIGIDGLMVFPALTYKSDDRETIQFYKSVAQASGLAILLYNNPRGYGVDLTADVVAQLMDEPTVEAIKEESYETHRVPLLMNRFGERLAVVCGVDNLLLESAAMGVTCWVSGMVNAVPNASVQLLRLATAGDFATARRIYAALAPLYYLDTVPKLVQHIKLAENIVCGAAEIAKPPRLPLAGAEREATIAITRQVLKALKELGVQP